MDTSFIHNPPNKINFYALIVQGGIFILMMTALCLTASILNTHIQKIEKKKHALKKQISTFPKQFKQKHGAKLNALTKEEKINFRKQKNTLLVLNHITSLLPSSCKLNNIIVSNNGIVITGLTKNVLSLTDYTKKLNNQSSLQKLSIGEMKRLPQSMLSSFKLSTNKNRGPHE